MSKFYSCFWCSSWTSLLGRYSALLHCTVVHATVEYSSPSLNYHPPSAWGSPSAQSVVCPVLLEFIALPTFAGKGQGHGLGYCMTVGDVPPRRRGRGGKSLRGWDGCGMGVMCLMRSGRPCVLAAMTMQVVMRVLVVVPDDVEFAAGRGGRCGNYTVRASTYARLRSSSIWCICTVCTVTVQYCTYSAVPCRGRMATQHHHHQPPIVAGACRKSDSSLVDGDGGGRVWIGMGADRCRRHRLIGPQRRFSSSKAMGWAGWVWCVARGERGEEG